MQILFVKAYNILKPVNLVECDLYTHFSLVKDDDYTDVCTELRIKRATFLDHGPT
jgi:hypothetical protein